MTEKQEVQASKPKEAMPSPPEPKQEEKKEAKAQEKPVPVAEQKADPIAEALKKDEKKKEAKVEKPKTLPTPPKKQPEFDPKKIAALLDRTHEHVRAAEPRADVPDRNLGADDRGRVHDGPQWLAGDRERQHAVRLNAPASQPRAVRRAGAHVRHNCERGIERLRAPGNRGVHR